MPLRPLRPARVARRASPRPEYDRAVAAGYHPPRAFRDRVHDRAAMAGPRARLEVVGETVAGAPVEAVTVGPPGGRPHPARPQAVVLAAIHGCEVISSELALDLLGRLTDSPPSGRAADLLAVADVTVVPALNLDGRAASFRGLAGASLHNPAPRRNANGVDLNRNWPFPDGVEDHWLPISGTDRRWLPWYRGPAPLSEPESRAFAALLDERRPFALLNLHSTGAILTHPWSAKEASPDDLAGFRAMIDAFTAAQPRWRYRSKQSRAWYPIIGSSNDYAYDRYGTLPLTVESSPPAATVKADRARARWDFWYANPLDRDAWVDNDLEGCLAALLAAHAYRVGDASS